MCNDYYLKVINDSLSSLAVDIIIERKKFVDNLNMKLKDIFFEITGYDGLVLKYISSVDIFDDKIKMKNMMIDKLTENFDRDKFYGMTVLGPHRDDYSFILDGKDLALYGSQGQNRLAILSLKLAEIHIFEETTNDSPILLLDDIQDPGNLGTIIRSSKAFNIDTIIISPNTVDIYNSKVLRSTQGMIFHINIMVRDLESFISELKEDNYKIYGTKVDGGINVKDIDIPCKYALVIGNEGNGMSVNISNLCDENLYIKMNTEVESLNAAVATSILLYEMDDRYEFN